MASEINVKQILQEYRNAYPELRTLTDEEILSVLNNASAGVNLSADERVSMFGLNEQGYSGLGLEKQKQTQTMPDTNTLEAALRERINKVSEDTQAAEKNNSWIGKAWSWTKNTFGFGDSSNKVRDKQKDELQALNSGNIKEAFKSITGLDYTPENVSKFLNNEIKTTSEQALDGYKEGQDMASDIAGDIVSGIAAVGLCTIGIATGGIGLGLGLAIIGGGLLKSGVKALDTAGTDKKYDSFGHDLITGAFSGLLAPITGGLGGAVGKTIAAKTGVQVLKHTGEKAVESGVKAMLTNPAGYQYVGGTVLKRGLAIGAEMAVDGATGGAIDTAFRTGVEQAENGEELDFGEIGMAAIQGGVGGLFMAPIIGGGIRGAGKVTGKLASKNGEKALDVNPVFWDDFADFNPATSKRQLLKQLKQQNIDSKRWNIRSLFENCKTPEDFQRASVLIHKLPKNALESISNLHSLTHDMDDAAIMCMLFRTKGMYDIEKVIPKIKENPLLYKVYEEFLPLLSQRGQSSSFCTLERTVAEHLKTPEQCEAFMHLTKEFNGPTTVESLYHNGFVPRDIADADNYLSILRYSSSYTFEVRNDINSAYLSLPLETRTLFDRFLTARDYAGRLDNKLFMSLLQGLHNSDVSEPLALFIKNAKDLDDLSNKFYAVLRSDFEAGNFDKEVVERLNRLNDTGVEFSYYDYEYYTKKGKFNDGTIRFSCKDKYFDDLITRLNDKSLKSSLGRVPTFDEVQRYSRIKTDVQKKFVLERLNPDMEPNVITGLMDHAACIQNREQFLLADFLRNKESRFSYVKGDWGGSTTGLYEYLKTAEDIDAFKALYERLPLESREMGDLYCRIVESGENVALKMDFAERIPNLVRENRANYICDIKNKYQGRALIELDSLLERYLSQRDNIISFLGDKLKGIEKEEDIKVLSKNIRQILESEDETLSKIFSNSSCFWDGWNGKTINFSDWILNKNLNFGNLDKVKHLRQSGWDNYAMLVAIQCDSDVLNTIVKREGIDAEFIGKLGCLDKKQIRDVEYLIFEKFIDGNLRFSGDDIVRLSKLHPQYSSEIKHLLTVKSKDNQFFDAKMLEQIAPLYREYPDEINKIINMKVFSDIDQMDIYRALGESARVEQTLNIIRNFEKLEIDPQRIPMLVREIGNIDYKQLRKLNRILGREVVSKLEDKDIVIACQFVDIAGKTNINEISSAGKKQMLRSLVACNNGLFEISDDMKRLFPLIPTDRDTYCSLLPSIVRSLGIETNTLTPQKVEAFNTSLRRMSSSLEEISDADFARLRITQDIPNETFIRTVLDKVKHLSPNERQKVYDYFGFELHHNKNNDTRFSITGYPVNLNNGHKLAQITDPDTKAVVEALRGDVIAYSRNNRIRCSDPQLETFLNDIAEALPEIHSMIGKRQHGAYDFDVMQHSVKVMQKISQDAKFKTLNESDKKIMCLAALMHDITKIEGITDKTHSVESAFDTFFIAKKFNLSKEEEIKLYTLCKHHEWLQYVNTAKSEYELTRRLQSAAFDLQHDNLIDMAEIFTHADLRAVKFDDSFHNKPRAALGGASRSYGESADVYAARLREYVAELQKSQPLLPVTKMPTAGRVKQAITRVNPDGSTNLRGVYQDKDGLVIIKYNETDEAAWVAMGLPAGSSPRGYKLTTELGEEVNTGNIKFFVHGLDYENQLAKFDAFSLVDSEVLLSVSYAERVESKYGFFRTQGVLLDAKTNYVHGGGNTDSGSGCGKFISEFKNRYIFGGERESDRLYISNLIKEATGMDDAQYVQFIQANRNKSMIEIEPVEYRDKIINVFATINSNTRKGNRAYNEMYISNPEVMGVFAYSADRQVGMPVEFVGGNENVQFLKSFALERDLPFIVFGD